MCLIIDRNSHKHAGWTNPGSALGPDWHQGIVLRGAEQVRQSDTSGECGSCYALHTHLPLLSGDPQSFRGIPVRGGKDLHPRGAAPFCRANTETGHWWELPPPLFPAALRVPQGFLCPQWDPGQFTSSWPTERRLAVMSSSAPSALSQIPTLFYLATL